MDKIFSKILIAKYSPENKCLVEDGAILIVLPKKITDKKKDSVSHYFIDSLDRKTKSQYGWIKTVVPFKFEEFINKFCQSTKNEEELGHTLKMLDDISILNDDIPVAATYFERGVEENRLEFKVHRVFFR